MLILSIAIAVFVVIETLNILTLYFAPGTRIGNGVGVFDAYEGSKAHPESHAFIDYLVNWVAGTKLIFVALLVVILVTGTETTRLFAVVVLIPAVLTYFWRLGPSIGNMDRAGWITPAGYSKTLGVMIAAFVAGFVAAVGVYLLVGGA
jgi:hypothetical protein